MGTVDLAAAARSDARNAAARASIRITEAHDVDTCRRLSELLDEVWGRTDRAVLAPEVIRALSHSGNQVSVAYDASNRLVAGTVAFFGEDDTGRHLHSHITGVRGDFQARGLGLAMKLHQRAWALERDIDRVVWTFDPLVRRNAWFNIGRLGADVSRYLEDVYGPMDDAVNRGVPSDRLVATWQVRQPWPPAGVDMGIDDDPPSALRVDAGMRPLVDGSALDAPRLRVQVPQDIETLRRNDPDLGAAWSEAIRETLGFLLRGPYYVSSFSREGWYHLRQASAPAATNGAGEPAEAQDA